MDRPEAPTFRTEEVVIGQTTMVRLHGELDIEYQPEVVSSFDHALERHPSVLAADLRGLSFMDSTGVHALIDTERKCRARDVRFLVVRGSICVNRVLAVLGLHRLFEIIPSPEHLPADSAVLAVAL